MLRSRIVICATAALVAVGALAAVALAWPDVRVAALIAIALIAAATGLTLVYATIRTGRTAASAAAGLRALERGELGHRLTAGEGGDMATAFNRAASSLEALVAAASQERSRLTAALNSSTDAVVAVDAQTRVTFANSAAGRLLGRDAEIALGSPFVWLVPNQDLAAALRSSREGARSETRIIERPNREFFRVIVTPIVGGGDWSSLVVFQDLTDVKRVEQVRRDFVANVSHELRTPLAAVKAVIETLQGGALEDASAARGFLAQADAEVDRLVQMVEELLELSLIESGEVPLAEEAVQVSDVLASAVERLRAQAQRQKLRLSLEASGGATVQGDRVRLERAVVNLIHNALKFTPEGGSVQVSAAAADGGGVVVRVEDTGPGIEPQDLPRVFERFYKGDRSRVGGGTGLGLAVVKHTIEAHGGTVSAESEAGKGSRFTFWLPVGDAGAEPPDGSPH